MSAYDHQHPEPDCAPLPGPSGEPEWVFPDPLPVPLPREVAVEVIAGEFLLLRELHREYDCILQRIAECVRDVMGEQR